MSMKKTYLIASLISAFLLLPIIALFVFSYISTRKYTPDLTGYAPNPAISCVQYDYNFSGHTGENARNLSGIGSRYNKPTDAFLGSKLLCDYEAYAAVVAEVKEIAEKYNVSESGSISSDEIDPAFFQEHDMLMVDFADDYAVELYPRLDHLTVSGGTASVDLQYDTRVITTGDNRGVLYLVPIPKGCTSSNVKLVRVTDWTDLKN